MPGLDFAAIFQGLGHWLFYLYLGLFLLALALTIIFGWCRARAERRPPIFRSKP